MRFERRHENLIIPLMSAKSPLKPLISTATAVASGSLFIYSFTALIPFADPRPLEVVLVGSYMLSETESLFGFLQTVIGINSYWDRIS